MTEKTYSKEYLDKLLEDLVETNEYLNNVYNDNVDLDIVKLLTNIHNELVFYHEVTHYNKKELRTVVNKAVLLHKKDDVIDKEEAKEINKIFKNLNNEINEFKEISLKLMDKKIPLLVEKSKSNSIKMKAINILLNKIKQKLI